jgi:hypothetical protein
VTRRGAPAGAPLRTGLHQAICSEDSIPQAIAGHDALLEAAARARALHADLAAVLSGRWAPELAVFEALADLADAAATWVRTAARRAAA